MAFHLGTNIAIEHKNKNGRPPATMAQGLRLGHTLRSLKLIL
jgi:hypothetical protein